MCIRTEVYDGRRRDTYSEETCAALAKRAAQCSSYILVLTTRYEGVLDEGVLDEGVL